MAEVLITLTIIGVIAAITIPTLMRKWEESHTVAGVKSALSILSNATKKAIVENGTIDTWGQNGNNFADSFVIVMKNYLKGQRCYMNRNDSVEPVSKVCYDSKKLCSSDGWSYYYSLSGGCATGNADSISFKTGLMILDNGMIVWFRGNNNDNGVFVDINGQKGPNRYGYDVFVFRLDNEKGVTLRTPFRNGLSVSLGAPSCSPGHSGFGDGLSCSSWIIKHGNTDYQKRDISAEW